MKRLLAGLLLVCSAAAQSLPDAPRANFFAVPVNSIVSGAVLGSRIADWQTTQECVRLAYAGCHEISLPTTITNSPGWLAVYELGTTGGSIYGHAFLRRHGHGRLGLALQVGHVAYITGVAIHNYRTNESLAAGWSKKHSVSGCVGRTCSINLNQR